MDAAVLDLGTEEEEKERLRNAVRLIRLDALLKNVPIVFIPENDPGSSTSHAPEALAIFNDITSMHECTGRMPGVPKTDSITYYMHSKLYSILLEGCIYFYENMQSLSYTVEEMQEKLYSQMGAYVWDVKEVRHNLDKVRVKLTGKRGGAQDDLLVTILMIPYWRLLFLESEYQLYKEFKMRYLARYM